MAGIGDVLKGPGNLLHAAEDAIHGAGRAVKAVGEGIKQAEEHVWHGTVDGVKAVTAGAERAAADVEHGLAQGVFHIAEGAQNGDVVGGVLHAGADVAKAGGHGLDDAWHGLADGADKSLHANLDAMHVAGVAAGRAYDAGVDGAARAVGDVAGKKAGDAVRRDAQAMAAPVRVVARGVAAAVGGLTKGALGAVRSTGDLVVGGVRMGTDAEFRDKMIAKAGDTVEALGNAELAALHDPAGTARKVETAANGALDHFTDDGLAAMHKGQLPEFVGDKVGGVAFQVLSVLVPFAKSGAVGRGMAKVGQAVSKMGRGGEVAGDVGQGINMAGDAKKAADAAAVTRKAAGAAGRDAEGAGSLGGVRAAAGDAEHAPIAGGQGHPPAEIEAQAKPASGENPADPATASTPAPRTIKHVTAAANGLGGRSPLFAAQRKALEDQGWRFKAGESGKGYFTSHVGKTITIDTAMSGEQMASHLAHEVGHATFDKPHFPPHPGMTKAEYISGNVGIELKNEGAAMLNEMTVRDQWLQSSGGKHKLPMGQGMEKGYQDVFDRFKAGKLSLDDAHEQMGQVIAKDRPSVNPNVTYEQHITQHLENEWKEKCGTSEVAPNTVRTTP